MKKYVNIFTDGACSGNQESENTGGWGAILEYGAHQKEMHGGEADTTNNRMEMTALLYALKAIKKENQTIRIFSDSAYLVNCFREKWYENWYTNNWKTSKKTDVDNKDIWEKLISFINIHTLEFYKVKGHINPDSPNTNLENHYKKFIDQNGDAFSINDFEYIVKMNNRADALANLGIDEIRNKQPSK